MGWEYAVYNNSTGLWSNYFPLTGVSGSSNVFTNLTSTTRYRVNVKSGVCNELTSNVVVVNVTNYPAASISVVGISCASNNATVAINVTGMGGYSGTYSGTLSDGTTFSGASSPLSATSATIGSALTIASLTADLGGCTTTTGFSGSVTLNTYYADTDADGFGSASSGTSICSSALSGYVALSTDCDDNAAASYPDAPEICNNTIDENCDGSDEICAGDAFSGPVVATTIGQFGTGVQFNSTVNLATASGSIQSPGIGNDVWYQFTAQFNAIRIALTGSSNVADDNDLGLYNNPANPSIQLQPIVTENDVHPGDVGTLNADGGSETLLYGNLVVGQVYYICVRNNNNTPGTCGLMISYLRGSQADIGPYTGGTGVYNNTCSNFKAAFRANASGYTVKRWTSTTITGTPSWVFAIPSGTICQLGRILPANMTGTPVTHYVTVDVAYNLPDAYGTLTPITANGTVASPVGLNSEAAVTVRAADQCTLGFKSATTGSIATDRSVCGTDRYNWQFTQVFPLTGLPLSFNGGAGATRIFPLSTVTGIANGQRYNVKVRSIHVDGVSMSAFGATPACVKTIGAAGMATENTNETYAQSINGDVVTSIFPNPNNGQSVNLSVVGMEGELQVRIVDATGRMVYANRYIVEGSINTSIDFGQTLAGGVYMVEMIQNGDMQTMRMVVNR
jgi:hypothetical protein